MRSGGLCEKRGPGCGRLAGDIHHLIFRSRGGTNELENLLHTCLTCHKRFHAGDSPKRNPSDAESIQDRLLRKIKW